MLVKDDTGFERILAQFVDAVKNEKEPCCYGRATNTDVVGYIQDGRPVCEIYTFACAGIATFRAHYVQRPSDPFNPYWDVYRKRDDDAGYFDDWGWEHIQTVDDPGMACYEEDA